MTKALHAPTKSPPIPQEDLPHNIYRNPQGKTLRIINERILVKMLPPRERTAGGIIVPATAGDRGDAGILTMGIVLAYGFLVGTEKKPIARIPIPDITRGDQVTFIRYYAEQHSNVQVQYRFEEGVIFLKREDIIVEFHANDAHRVLI